MNKLLLILAILSLSVAALAQENNKETESDSVFLLIDEHPEYPGGDEARIQFIVDNINYPEIALESGIQGTVYISFVVEKDGSISNVKVLRGIGGGCDEEAMRVVKAMPKWKPGKQKGKVVRAQFNMPIKFILNGGSDNRTYNNNEVDKAARFPGGEIPYLNYKSTHLKYPRKSRKDGVEGEVVVKFKVHKYGKVSNAQVVKSLDAKCDKAALKFVKNMPDWESAVHKGAKVNVIIELPIEFEIADNEESLSENRDVEADESTIVTEKRKVYNETENDEQIFVFLEENAEFKGGKKALDKYMEDNLNYPESAKAKGVEGTVYLTFVVENDGSITNIRVLRGVNEELDREAVRLVQSMPKWNPGKQRGRAVRCQYNLPVKFILNK